MIFSKIVRYFSFIATAALLNGCYLEQGKLHFDELNLDPIIIYEMASPETIIYCLAEGDIPTGDKLLLMHKQSMTFVENDPEKANWGEIVCLALADDATISQMKETVNVLQLVIAVRPKKVGPPRAYKKILEQRIFLRQTIDRLQMEQIALEREQAEEIAEYEGIIRNQVHKTNIQKERVKELEQQVEKLKEIELLLQPKP